MTDAYLRQVLARYAIDNGYLSPARAVQATLMPTVQQWGNRFLLSVDPSGSFAKGTAVRGGTDIDLFVSLSSATPETLSQIYESLLSALAAAGYQPRRQNVSIGVRVGSYSVDIVPGKRQSQYGDDHSLYSNRSGNWLQTNVTRHIAEVRASSRADEIRLLKIWRNRKRLDFPSFYLELAVIRALSGCRAGNLAANIVTALEFIRDNVPSARFVDPANTNNIVSDTVAVQGKQALSSAARAALASSWQVEFQ